MENNALHEVISMTEQVPNAKKSDLYLCGYITNRLSKLLPFACPLGSVISGSKILSPWVIS